MSFRKCIEILTLLMIFSVTLFSTPEIDVSPDSFSNTLSIGWSEDKILQLNNLGDSDLAFDIYNEYYPKSSVEGAGNWYASNFGYDCGYGGIGFDNDLENIYINFSFVSWANIYGHCYNKIWVRFDDDLDGIEDSYIWLEFHHDWGPNDEDSNIVGYSVNYTDFYSGDVTIPLSSLGLQLGERTRFYYMIRQENFDGGSRICGFEGGEANVLNWANVILKNPDSWISEDNTSGIIPSISNEDITVTFDATQMTVPAMLSANIFVINNDADERITKIPVSLEVISTAFLLYSSHEVDDDSTGGSSGNNDSIVSPGESIESLVTINNNGNVTAVDVEMQVSTLDPYITLIDDLIGYGDITLHSTKQSTAPFSYSVDSGTPNNHEVTFDLLINDSSGNSWTDNLIETVKWVPEINLLNDAINETVVLGLTAEHVITIENLGSATLSYSLYNKYESFLTKSGSYTSPYSEKTPVIDGVISGSEWNEALNIIDGCTSMYMQHDNEYIYFAFRTSPSSDIAMRSGFIEVAPYVLINYQIAWDSQLSEWYIHDSDDTPSSLHFDGIESYYEEFETKVSIGSDFGKTVKMMMQSNISFDVCSGNWESDSEHFYPETWPDVTLQYQPQWVSEDVYSGTVDPFSHKDITVEMDSSELSLGSHQAQIVINNNDSDEDPYLIPVTLNVIQGNEISGVITHDSSPLTGIEVQLFRKGELFQTTYSDSVGAYVHSGVPGETHTLVPVSDFYTFSPSQYYYDPLDSDQIDQDFDATLILRDISGVITNGVSPVFGVTVDLGGTDTRTLSTSVTGYFSFTGISSIGNYTVIPSMTNYIFSPQDRNYPALPQNVTNCTFTGTLYSGDMISGVVTSEGVGLEGVTMDLTGSSTSMLTTSSTGYFKFVGLSPMGNYSITPSKTNCEFDPVFRNYINLLDDVSDCTFAATVYSGDMISGVVTSEGVGLGGVAMDLTGSSTAALTTSSTGYYQFTGLAEMGYYTVTPSSSGCSFLPVNRTYDNLVEDILTADFAILEPTVDFTEINIGNLTGISSSVSEFGDLDEDGDLDLVVLGLGDAGRVSQVLMNNGNGFFVEEIPGQLYGVNDGSISLGDLDMDGDLDLIISGWNGTVAGRRTLIYLNDGAGSFTEGASASLENLYRSNHSLGDIDGDGDLDLILTGFTGSANRSRIYQNDGVGSFTEINAGQLEAVRLGPVALGDIDNDGDLDLILTGWNGSACITKTYQNNGTGNFTEINSGQFAGVDLGSVSFGDVDSDGDLDIVLSGQLDLSGNPFTGVYRNDGTGSYTEISPSQLRQVRISSMALGDLDHDGDLDIVLVGNTSTSIVRTSEVYVNEGSGLFAMDGYTALTDIYAGSTSLGDIDNDGDLDLILTGASDSGRIAEIYRNNTLIINATPSPPSNLAAIDESGHWKLSWDVPADDLTSAALLRYHIAIGTSAGNYSYLSDAIMYPHCQANLGNTLKNDASYLSEIPTSQEIFWKVCAIDTSFKSSTFLEYTADFASTPKYLSRTMDALSGDSEVLTLANENSSEITFTVTDISYDSHLPNEIDNFGYTYIDSDQAGGPVYDWIDITAIGTEITGVTNESIHGQYALGFDFTFYGNTFDQIYVSDNGYISFTDTVSGRLNESIPSVSAPRNMIAPLWHDLKVYPKSEYYWWSNGSDTFVISWIGVYENDWRGPYDFQVILKNTGEIKFQYGILAQLNNRYTVGIQNGDGSIGLKVALDEVYLHNEMAIEIFREWLSISPESGNIAAGGTADIDFVFNASQLKTNTYTATVEITSSDGDDPVLEIPVTLGIRTSPNIRYFSQVLDDDNSGSSSGNDNGIADPGETIELGIALENFGTAAGDGITAILSSSDTFVTIIQANGNYGTILTGNNASDIYIIEISSPVSQGYTIPFDLNITDGSSRTWNDDFTIEIDNTPHIGISPWSFSNTINFNSAVTDTLSIENGGGAPLEYIISLDYHVSGQGPSDNFGYTFIDSDQVGGPAYNWVDISAVGTEILTMTNDSSQGPF
ncbi:VCBS repeat-containing protein, partial [bacterium]|nr:VCBS repeat-containing protein [bacterium]